METIRGTVAVLQTHMSRILLAHHTATVRISHPNERSLAICSVGAQRNGTLPHGNTAAQVPCHKNRLLH